MTFSSEVGSFIAKTKQNLSATIDGVDAEVFRSVVHGSEITGAPGQPVDPDNDPNAGKLRDSWESVANESETVIATDVPYAPDVEDNTKNAHFRTGGPHSVKLTESGFPRIVETVAARVTGS